MKKTLIAGLFFIISHSSLNAQILNDKNFVELIQISKKFYFSDSNLKEFELSKEFFSNLNTKEIQNEDDLDFEDWLNKNLSLTKFSNVKEGIEMYNLLNEITKSNDSERIKITNSYNELAKKYTFDKFINAYNKEMKSVNDLAFSELNFDCEKKFDLINFNSYADYINDVSLFESESEIDLIKKKFDNNIHNAALTYENCLGIN